MDSLKRKIAHNSLIRKAGLRLLRLLAHDITINNQWSGQKIKLNIYAHKGYWFYNRDREYFTMKTFGGIISKGSTVFEVGGHIGYISQYFSKLVGGGGKVIVFEPGDNNLPYLLRNIEENKNISIEKIAVSNNCGFANFFEDNITGQNNSLLEHYHGAESVSSTHGHKLVRTLKKVEVTTLDSYIARQGIAPDFVKIDIEGFELEALQGMRETLGSLNCLMVEVTRNHSDVWNLLTQHGFQLHDESLRRFPHFDQSFNGNVFAVREPL